MGGLEKTEGTGNVSYDPINHERMVETRERKVQLVAEDIPPEEMLPAPEQEPAEDAPAADAQAGEPESQTQTDQESAES